MPPIWPSGGSCILCAVAKFLFCTGLARRSKTGKENSKTCHALVILCFPQVVFCCGGLVAAAAFVGGIVKCYQALPAAARSRAFVLPFVKDLEVVFSTAVSVMGQCEVMSYGLRLVRCAVTSGHVLGLRIDEVLKPHREGGQVVAGCLSVGNGVQATGRVDVPGGNILTAMWGTPSNIENALTFRFCLVNAADFAVYDAAMSGHARRWLCQAMACATVRFALFQWLAALIAACGVAATGIMNCFQLVFVLWSLVPGFEKTRILSVFERGTWNEKAKDTSDVSNFETEVLSAERYLTEPVLSEVVPQPVREIQVFARCLAGRLLVFRVPEQVTCSLLVSTLFLPSCSILR